MRLTWLQRQRGMTASGMTSDTSVAGTESKRRMEEGEIWRDGPVVKGMYCSSTGSEFESQHSM